MAISGIQVISIGLPNESTGSDSLLAAFTKTQNNFETLFDSASPYNTFTGNTGISTTANSSTGIVTITNTGVTSLTAGTGITLTGNTGNIVISSTGGSNGNVGVTSVGLVPVSTARLAVTNSPIVSTGNIGIDLVATGVTAGTYTYPTVAVDAYGRVTSISNASSVGTVTSVAVAPGDGIQVTGTNPITTTGTINIINTGVTRLSAGTGITLSGSNGNVTVSTSLTGGTVTSVGLTSNSLTVTNSPVTTTGTFTVESPIGFNSENLADGGAANLAVTASYFTTTTASTATLAAGTAGLIKTFMMVADGGDMVITVTNAGWKTSGTGTITFGDIGDGCTLQYINSKWYCIGQNGVAFA